jgi:hypothetical protein
MAGAIFSLASVFGSAAAGAVLGALGSHIATEQRIIVATIFAPLALIVGTIELFADRAPVLQCNRETPQRWVHGGALRWAVQNGLVLGVGATSRIGFWLWYVVPVGAFAIGEASLSAALYGAYGFVRGVSLWPILLASRWASEGTSVTAWLLQRYKVARLLTSLQLVAIGAMVSIAVGL